MNDKVKVIIIAICLLGAGVAVAFQLGVFSSGPKGATSTETAADDLPAPEPGSVSYQENASGGMDGRVSPQTVVPE